MTRRTPLAALATAAALAAASRAGAPAASAARPVVWVQAGHQASGEPGYRAQAGAGGGPFGSEVGLTTRVGARLEARLRAAGVDARHTPARVTPAGAAGDVFISVHDDAPGEAPRSLGRRRPVPGREPIPRRGDRDRVAAALLRLRPAPARQAGAVAVRFARVFTPANGARTRFLGIDPRAGDVAAGEGRRPGAHARERRLGERAPRARRQEGGPPAAAPSRSSIRFVARLLDRRPTWAAS